MSTLRFAGLTTGLLALERAGITQPPPLRDQRGVRALAPQVRTTVFEEREEIAILRAQDKGVREIARAIGRDPATVSRELRRNAGARGAKQEYRAVVAQWKAQQAAKRPKIAKLVENPRLREYVQDRLARERPPP